MKKSTIGYIFLLDKATISWSTKQQLIVGLCTIEVEYMVLCQATIKVMWLRRLLSGLKFMQNEPIMIQINSHLET
jgi:hypothetical protein